MLSDKIGSVWISKFKLIFSSLASGTLITLSLSPFDQWFLGILGCLFLLLILNQNSKKNAFWIGWLFGIGLFTSGASWISVSIDLYGGASTVLASTLTLIFCFGLGLFYAIFSFIYAQYLHNFPLGSVLGFPALWVLFEWLRSWIFSGFPWLYLGYAHLDTPLSAFAPLGSVFCISFVCVLSASLLFLLISNPMRIIKIKAALFLAFIWTLGFALKNIEWTSSRTQDALNVVVYQPNIAQEKKWDRRYKAEIKNQLARRVKTLFGQDLIVLPEAAIPDYYRNSLDLLKPLADQAEINDSALILGIPTLDVESTNSFNSVLSLGIGQGIYHKRRLVPFGEFVPFEKQLRGVIEFFDLPMSNFSPGKKVQSLLKAKNIFIAPFVCYEIAYPDLVLEGAKKADIIVTLSNDTWFGNSIGPHQHLQIARMRALETGRYIIRATNNGISAIINHKGSIVSKSPQFAENLLYGKVYSTRGSTPANSIGLLGILSICFVILSFFFCRPHLASKKELS